MDRTERKSWFRFLDEATDAELSRAQVLLGHDLHEATHPDVIWDAKWKLRKLCDEIAARAEVARLRKRFTAG